MSNFASVYVKKVSIGKGVTQATQIAVIFEYHDEMKCLHYFIDNGVKQSVNAVNLKDALMDVYEVIKDKTIVLQNYNRIDYLYLKKCYETLELPFNNKIIDITKKALDKGITKPNIDNLCRIYHISTHNDKKIPSALFEARKLYLLAIKMFSEQ